MNKLLASLIVTVPLLAGSTALFAGELNTASNHPILPITTNFDKPIVGAQEVAYWHHGQRWRHGQRWHHGHRWHRQCWRGPRGHIHCRRW